ncbi:hypothetical protein D3C78_1551420 [compost metagenome]
MTEQALIAVTAVVITLPDQWEARRQQQIDILFAVQDLGTGGSVYWIKRGVDRFPKRIGTCRRQPAANHAGQVLDQFGRVAEQQWQYGQRQADTWQFAAFDIPHHNRIAADQDIL